MTFVILLIVSGLSGGTQRPMGSEFQKDYVRVKL